MSYPCSCEVNCGDIHQMGCLNRASARTRKLLELLHVPPVPSADDRLPLDVYVAVNKYLSNLEHEVFDVTKRRAAAIATEKVGHTIKDYLPGSVIAAKIMAMRMI